MTKSDDYHLIIGRDSTIGAALEMHLLAKCCTLTSTTRHEQSNGFHLDLENPIFHQDWRGSILYLCAAIPNLKACESAPRGTAKVNVEGAIRLIKSALRQEAFVIFYSTNHVFDGAKAYRKPEDHTAPVIEYGRQKEKVEKWLLQHAPNQSAIIRMTRVVGDNLPIFERWASDLNRSIPIHPFQDMMLSPLPLNEVVRCSIEIGRQRLAGIHHLSGDQDISYAEAAEVVAKELGAPSGLVQPTSWRERNIIPHPPAHTTLAPSDMADLVGFQPPNAIETIRSILKKKRLFNRQIMEQPRS